MSTQPILTDAVFAATSLGSRITKCAVKAKYAPASEGLVRIREARALLRQLDGKLALAEAAIGTVDVKQEAS